MYTVIYTLIAMLVVGVSLTRFDSPVDPVTGALVAGIIVLLFRAKRAYGISLHLDELMDEQSQRYDDWNALGKLNPGERRSERNNIAREIDATNEDLDNLNRIRW